jgi:hypothetical protein
MGGVAGGIAYDEVEDLVYVSVSQPTAIDWVTDVYVAPGGSRCQPLCTTRLPRCGPFYPRAGVVTGLGFDACTRLLHATNGTWTQALTVADPRACRVESAFCCQKQTAGTWQGLDILPGWTQRPAGASCADAGCMSCPQLSALLTGGDPSLGNQDFGIAVAAGEPMSLGLLVLAGGACTPGIRVPFLCGPVHPALAPAPLVLPPVVLSATGPGCTGTALVPIPIPADRGLCGIRLCAQWLLACPPTFRSFALTHAIEFDLTGS